jgi:hypothetical protein
MAVLSGLGLMHARRTAPATDILTGHPAPGTTAPHNGHPSELHDADLAATAPGSSDTPPA